MAIKPYYSHAGITIYHGDCREVLPQLECLPDLVLTDPPYGVGFVYESHKDYLTVWKDLMTSLVGYIRARAVMGVLPSCQINQLGWIYRQIPPDWLICWYKGSPGHSAFIGFNDWEPLLVYGKPHNLQMHDYFYAQPEPPNGHPCPKPVEWAKWIIARASRSNGLIVDPFCGSGTTLVAAKDLGRKAIGIELEEKYAEIAAKRLSQEVLNFG